MLKSLMTLLIIFAVLSVGGRLAAEPLFDAAVNYPVGAVPNDIFSADYDGDGDEDLAVTNSGSDNIGILMNNGDGTFATPVDYYVGENTHSVFSEDFDRDGYPDLVVSNYNSSSCVGVVSVLINNGDGTFAPPVNYVAGGCPQSVFSADFDGNGSPDLAVANAGSDDVSVLINNGDGTFAAPVNYPVGNYTVSVISADFDGDGCLDLAVVGFWTYDVSIMINNCDGSFAPPVSYPVGALPTSVFAADYDGDGDEDLAVTNGGPDNVSVLLNNGYGIFGLAGTYPVGAGPRSVIAADFNGNGFADLAVSNQNSDDLSILMNNGDSSFAVAFSLPVGDQPYFISSADFDNNGFPDLAVPNKGSNTVSILMNQLSMTLPVHLDIKPGSCPNPLNVKVKDPDFYYWEPPENNNGGESGNESSDAYKQIPNGPIKKWAVVPAAILGTADFDASDINQSTITLEGIPVVRWNYEDVATPMPVDATECDCNADGPDGFLDLTLMFGRSELKEALGEVNDGDVITLTISGELNDGTPFEGTDCVIIRGNPEPEGIPFANNTSSDQSMLLGNYPNPFNPSTTIGYNLVQGGHVKLEIFNISGQRIVSLVNEEKEAGLHSVVWDGKDSSGRQVASGIYFYRLEAGEFSDTRKMILMK
ncbi:MAG: FG-GAP-like repeat-containing protein [candidate division Zixibacteria bacterium]